VHIVDVLTHPLIGGLNVRGNKRIR
jgi:hypothetical protein